MSDTEVEESEPQYSVVFEDSPATPLSVLSRDGSATAKFVNGDTYSGGYLSGKRHGSGVYTFANGARYSGDYVNGLKHGEGKFVFPDRSTYVGAWSRDRRHGVGVYTYPNKDRYEGEWKAGVRHGNGVYTYAATGHSVQGIWSNGSLKQGTWIQTQGQKYTGKFYQQQPSGFGLYSTNTGRDIAGIYTKTHTFIPINIQQSTVSTTVLSPSALTVATRALESCVLSVDHCEGVYRLKKEVDGVPNYRRVGESSVFLSGQPTISGLKAVIPTILEQGFDRIVWINTRTEPTLYILDNSYTPRHPKILTQPLSLPLLNAQDLSTLESTFTNNTITSIIHNGGLLQYYRDIYAELDYERQQINMEMELNTKTVNEEVRSGEQVFVNIKEEEGLAVDYVRAEVQPSVSPSATMVQEIQSVVDQARSVEEGVAIVFMDAFGKDQATFGAVVTMLVINKQNEPEEEEKEQEAEEEEEEEEQAEKVEEEKENDEEEQDKEKEEEEEEEEEKNEQEDEAASITADKKQETAEPAASQENVPAAEQTSVDSDAGAVPDTAAATDVPLSTSEATVVEESKEQPADTAAVVSSSEAVTQAAPPVVLSAAEKALLLQQGNLSFVSALTSVFPTTAVKAKQSVDAVIDQSQAMINLRECINYAYQRWCDSNSTAHAQASWLSLGQTYAHRYFWLIVLGIYLQEKPTIVVEEEKQPVPFTTFVQQHPEVNTIYAEKVAAFAWE